MAYINKVRPAKYVQLTKATLQFMSHLNEAPVSDTLLHVICKFWYLLDLGCKIQTISYFRGILCNLPYFDPKSQVGNLQFLINKFKGIKVC